MFGGQSCARHASRWRSCLTGETVVELPAVVGEDFADLDGRSQLNSMHETDATSLGHVAVDVHEGLAYSAIDSDKQLVRCEVSSRICGRYLISM